MADFRKLNRKTLSLQLLWTDYLILFLQAVLGMDILSQAKSGMGKTAVFVLATLQQIEPVDGQVTTFTNFSME